MGILNEKKALFKDLEQFSILKTFITYIKLSKNEKKNSCHIHFKLQLEKERHTLLCILKLFTDNIHVLSLKNAWLPPIFFLDFNRTC